MHKLIQDLKAKGWSVTASQHDLACLPDHVTERHKRIPDELLTVMYGIEECVAPDEKAWLLCRPDYEGTSESAFKWNEFELMSLEAADDEDLAQEITAFWDSHLPVYFSVRDGYSYVAVCTDEIHAGELVEGCEPDFEDTTRVASRLIEFIESL